MVLRKLLLYQLFAISILFVSSCGNNKSENVVETIRPVKYSKVSLSSAILNETFSGIAQSSKETKMSFKVGGTIKDLNIKVGDVIKKGQLVAKVDQTDYSVQYQQSVANMKSVETQIKSTKSQLINSKAAYARVEKLYENNGVSLSEFEQAKSTLELAQAAYDASLAQANASERQVESARNQVNYSNLTAPYGGIITAVFIEENEIIGSGAPVATITAIGDPEISIGIPEVYISKIEKGQQVEITILSLPDKIFSGKVYKVGYSTLGGSTYTVSVQIDDPTQNIRPGMAADVKFNFWDDQTQENDVLVAPVPAIGEDGKGNFVFHLESEGEHYIARKKTVQIGELNDSGFEIISGLSNGDIVATAGLNMLLDGMKVRLLDKNKKQ